jgi:hypothetical protein
METLTYIISLFKPFVLYKETKDGETYAKFIKKGFLWDSPSFHIDYEKYLAILETYEIFLNKLKESQAIPLKWEYYIKLQDSTKNLYFVIDTLNNKKPLIYFEESCWDESNYIKLSQKDFEKLKSGLEILFKNYE